MAKKKPRTGQEMAETVPGIHPYRRELILALCSGVSVNTNNHSMDAIARRVIMVANAIIELSEQ